MNRGGDILNGTRRRGYNLGLSGCEGIPPITPRGIYNDYPYCHYRRALPGPRHAVAVARALAAVNDRPHPALDAGRTAQKYAAVAQDFRRSAWQHLEEGDLP